TALSYQRTLDIKNVSGRFDFLQQHSTPFSILGRYGTERKEGDFLPTRSAEVGNLQFQGLLAARGDPIFLDWAATESYLDDPEDPRHTLVHSYSVGTKKRLGRDDDIAFRQEGLTAEDLLTGEEAERRRLTLKWEKRFLYDLGVARLNYEDLEESAERYVGLRTVTEEIELQNSPSWSSRLTLRGEENLLEQTLTRRAEAGFRTGGNLTSNWRLNVDGRGTVTESAGVTRRGLDTGLQLGWGGSVGAFRLSASGGASWQPSWGQGNHTFNVIHEPARLRPRGDLDARPLANSRIVLESVRVFLIHDLNPLTEGVDYELVPTVEVAPGVADQVYLWLKTPPSSRCPEPVDVQVNYSYQVPAGDDQRLVNNGSVSLSTTAGGLSLGIMANGTQIREYSAARGDTFRQEFGTGLQLGLVDGPFSVNATTTHREDSDVHRSTLEYQQGRTRFSETIERLEGDDWRRRRSITRFNSELGQSGVARFRGFAQYVRGQGEGHQAGREEAFQTGLQATVTPGPNLQAQGSLSYLRDWVNPQHDQGILEVRVTWWRGQLSLVFDSELQEDLGVGRGRGKFNLSVVRQF
ncbi:MAG: hypothetical protein ACM3UP_01685, partial [Methanocella sp.]